jgi:mannose-6-phosphate isomerase-like protein (cupin superfamily)
MPAPLSAADLLLPRGSFEKTASDMRIVARTARMGGHFSVMEGEVRPGELLAFHTHANEDQHMYIIEGELHFEVGGADGVRFTARAGGHVLKPRGTSHGFWNLGETTARYLETSTQDGFERFIDARQGGLGAMVAGAEHDLGMSFELERTVAVMREFDLTGLAGANPPPPHVLLREPAVQAMLREGGPARDLALHVGGARLREALGLRGA